MYRILCSEILLLTGNDILTTMLINKLWMDFYVLLTVHLDAIWVMTNLMQSFLMYLFLCLYMFRAASAHHQEDQIVLIHHLV
jgi:hypothetical protein